MNLLQKSNRQPNILRTLDRIRREEDSFSSLIDDLFHFHGFSPLGEVKNPNFSPSLDFVNRENDYLIKVETPGIEKEKINVEIDDDYLIIRGEKKDEYENTQDETYVVERSYGSFRREVKLPSDCEKEKIKADYENGLLSLKIPKVKEKEKKKKKITIET